MLVGLNIFPCHHYNKTIVHSTVQSFLFFPPSTCVLSFPSSKEVFRKHGFCLFFLLRERCKKKKLTNVSFPFTHTYTPVKTNIFPFFPQAYMEIFEKCAKTQKLKQQIFCPMLPVVVSFPPSFLNLSLM